jgi:hypothetical protein
VVHTNGETKTRQDPYQDVVSDHLAKVEKIKVRLVVATTWLLFGRATRGWP